MRNKEEYYEQCKVVKHVQLRYPGILMTISPSGLITSVGIAMKIKRMGYKAGTPDILFFEPNGTFKGLLIEMKTDLGTVSNEQWDFLTRANRNGFKVRVCRSAQEAIKTIDDYFSGKDPGPAGQL